jgi:hypothetical protein
MPAGYCLGLVQRVYGAPGLHNTAWEAWEATQLKHLDQNLPPVSVPVWFDHWGTYDGVYGRFGHVVAWVPGRGFLSSPGSGVGQKWLNTIKEIERFYNCTYVGWSEDVNSLQVVQYQPDPTPAKGKKLMGAFFRNTKNGWIYYQENPGVKPVKIESLQEWLGYAAQGNKYVDLSDADFKKLMAVYN